MTRVDDVSLVDDDLTDDKLLVDHELLIDNDLTDRGDHKSLVIDELDSRSMSWTRGRQVACQP